MRFLKWPIAACSISLVVAGLGMAVSSSEASANQPAVASPVPCGGIWFLRVTGVDTTGSFQGAVDAARVRASAIYGGPVEWAIVGLAGRAGGIEGTNEIYALMNARPSVANLDGLTPLDEGEQEARIPHDLDPFLVVGHDSNGDFQGALSDAIHEASLQFPYADTLFNWSAGPTQGGSSVSTRNVEINDIFQTIAADEASSLQGAWSTLEFLNKNGLSLYGSQSILAVGTSNTGNFQEALNNAIANAKIELNKNHIAYEIACGTGVYGSQPPVNIFNVYIVASPVQ